MTDWEKPLIPTELEMLEPFTGVWFTDDTYYPSPWNPEECGGKSRFDFRRTLRGFCLFSDFMGNASFGEYVCHGMWFFDRESKKYKVVMYDNFDHFMEGEGDFDKKGNFIADLKLSQQAEELEARHTLTLRDESNFEYKIEHVINGKLRPTAIHKCRRVK